MKYVAVGVFVALFADHLVGGGQSAVVVVPVADLLKVSLGRAWSTKDVAASYDALPYCHASYVDNHTVCPRTHQALYNTIVEIIEYNGDEVYVRVPYLFVRDKGTGKNRNAFWMLRSNLILLDQLTPDVLAAIPPSIDYHDPGSVCCQEVVTLTQPFHDATIGVAFSAGTRFVRAGVASCDGEPVYVLRNHGQHVDVVSLPRQRCVVGCPLRRNERIKNCVRLLREWVKCYDGKVVPFVWGGASFIDYDCEGDFELATDLFDGRSHSFFVRPTCMTGVKTGFDCSGLILRAAQISGVPYFCKNSHTVPQHLACLMPGELPKDGDIMQYTGHVLVVSSVEQNLAIEAAGYNAWHGIVHEVPLSRLFKDITMYEQLANRLHSQLPIERLDQDGRVVSKIDSFSILKMASVWHETETPLCEIDLARYTEPFNAH